jgi:hypothetical protein
MEVLMSFLADMAALVGALAALLQAAAALRSARKSPEGE